MEYGVTERLLSMGILGARGSLWLGAHAVELGARSVQVSTMPLRKSLSLLGLADNASPPVCDVYANDWPQFKNADGPMIRQPHPERRRESARAHRHLHAVLLDQIDG